MVTSPLLSFALMDSPFIHSFFSLSFLATTLYFLTFFGLCHVVTKGRDTLGDKLNSKMSPWQITPCLQFQRKVAAIHCFNKLLHVYWSLHFCENLYLHIYIYIRTTEFCCCNKSQKNQMILNLCDLLLGQNFVAETKILFTKIIHYTQSDLSLWCVTVTCCCSLSPCVYWP